MGRFSLMIKINMFMIRGRLTRQFGRFTSKCGVLTHTVETPMTRRASLSSFKNTSSESNNAPREKAGTVQSKHIWANAGFFRDVLRIYLSELDKIQNLPSWDAKE